MMRMTKAEEKNEELQQIRYIVSYFYISYLKINLEFSRGLHIISFEIYHFI